MSEHEKKEPVYKEPMELFEELKKELEFLPDEEAKAGIIHAFIHALTD